VKVVGSERDWKEVKDGRVSSPVAGTVRRIWKGGEVDEDDEGLGFRGFRIREVEGVSISRVGC